MTVSYAGETLIAGSTTLNAGEMYVNATTNAVVVCPSAQTASALATAVGASGIKTVDYPARFGAFPTPGCRFLT